MVLYIYNGKQMQNEKNGLASNKSHLYVSTA